MIIQRYASWLWAPLRGEAPLIVTGPNFRARASDGGGCRPFWRMLPGFVEELRRAVRGVLAGEDVSDSRRCVAELLLREGIVQGLWVSHTPEPNPLPAMDVAFAMCIDQLAREIPWEYHGTDLADNTLELLDSLIGPEYFRAMFAQHDEVTLEQQIVVV
jgi:hypothetical protein